MTTGDDTIARLSEDLVRYQESEAWPQVVETILQLVELDRDPMRKGKWYALAALICRDNLAMREHALEYYERALDAFFESPDDLPEAYVAMAFRPLRALERMRAEYSEWTELDRAYRRMIVRMKTAPRFDKLRAEVFDRLGELYRTQLDMETAAVTAFEQARRLDPNNEVRTEGVDRDGFLAPRGAGRS
jgi:tetratricopeptide (TPR) repeat protein